MFLAAHRHLMFTLTVYIFLQFALMAIMEMIVLWNVLAVLMKAVTPELDPVFMAARLDIMEAIAKVKCSFYNNIFGKLCKLSFSHKEEIKYWAVRFYGSGILDKWTKEENSFRWITNIYLFLFVHIFHLCLCRAGHTRIINIPITMKLYEN